MLRLYAAYERLFFIFMLFAIALMPSPASYDADAAFFAAGYDVYSLMLRPCRRLFDAMLRFFWRYDSAADYCHDAVAR